MCDVILEEVTAQGYHLGHLFVSLMSRNPDEINQVDAATGEKETNGSVLSRSVRLAKCLRRLGLQPGDVMALAGRNHIHVHIPYYAAMLNGLTLVGVDDTFKYDEIYGLFKLTKPTIVFCQYENSKEFERVARALNWNTRIITFDGEDCSMTTFMDSYNEDGSLDGFAQSDAPRKTEVQTSWSSKMALNLSTVHWVTGYFNPIGMALNNQCLLQTSGQPTIEHVIDMINEYKPVSGILVPSLFSSIMNHEKECDLSCFNNITLTGGLAYEDILVKLKPRLRTDAMISVAYGQTESLGPCLQPAPFGPLGNCGKLMANFEIKLVDPETGKEITKPNTPGELWNKGPRFTEYYNSPEETAQAFSEDGWYKTGDILYRDEDGYFFFVERLKMLIKYRGYQVSPLEIEALLRTHPDVFDVGVTSIPHEEDGEHPVACVVRRPGSDVTAAEVKQLVADKLSSSKQLRGGVVFLDELPLTAAGKLARMVLRRLVVDADRE